MNTNENGIITCAECGCIIEGEVIVINGLSFCSEDCANLAGYYKCDKCGQWEHEDDLVTYNDENYCESCRSEFGLTQCDECGEWYPEDELTEIDNGWRRSNDLICRGCLEDKLERDAVFYCADCEEYYNSRYIESFYTVNDETVCENCYSDHYITCADCGDVIYYDDSVYDEYEDSYYCESCYRHNHGARSIHDYGFRPSPVFHGLNHSGAPVFGDPITIGFELEIDDGDSRKDCSEELVNTFDEDTLYLKSDSSVDFEIVTHPHTLAAYMSELDTAKLCSIPKHWGYSSHNAGTCGLHCHVGRTQLGANEDERRKVIDRIVLLLYRHWNSIVKFSRRSSSQLSQWANKPELNLGTIVYTPDDIYSAIDNYYGRRGRYQALNLCNRGTIEFRLWRGTLCEETLLATLQLTSNIVRYCMENDLEAVSKSSWLDVCSVETYEELDSYLLKRDLVGGFDAVEVNVSGKEAQVSVKGVGRFMLGDTVMIVSNSALVSFGAIDLTGTVVYTGAINEYIPGDNFVLVQISNPDGDPVIDNFIRDSCHNGNGHADNELNYWCEPETLALIDRPIVPGARFMDTLYHRVVTIVTPDEGDGLLGADFGPGWDGHNLNGAIRTNTGYWVLRDELSVVGL